MRPTPAAHAPDALLDALLAVTRHHGRPVSAAAIIAGLPLVDGRLVPSLFERAATRAGLEIQVVDRPIAHLHPSDLPAVLVLADGCACLLLDLSEERAQVVEDSAPPRSIDVGELSARYLGIAFLVRPKFEPDARAPAAAANAESHWFVQALKRHSGLYRDVLLAAGMINLFALALPLFTMNVYDRVVPNSAVETLWTLASGVVIVLLADLMLRTMRSHFLDLANKRVDVEVSSDIMSRVLGMPLALRPRSVGAFAANLRAFEGVRDFATSATLATMIDLPFSLLFVAVIAWIAWPVALPVAFGGAIIVALAWWSGTRMHALTQTTYQANALRNAGLIESLVGLETVKTLGIEGIMQSRWERSATHLAEQGAELRRVVSMTQNAALFVQQLTAVLVVITGVYQIIGGHLSIGALIACSMLGSRALAPMSAISGLLTQYHTSRAALAGLDELRAQPTERTPGVRYLARPRVQGEFEFRDVLFQYPGPGPDILRGVSFRVRAGEKVAILGRTGSGKSTLLKLMLGLYTPQSGSILVDGIDIRQLDPAELRSNIGHVPQDILLFYGTLRDNLLLANPGADDDAMLRALERGDLHDFVRRHPSGIDMPVGERGELLSGGQRAGVAIARATLKDAPVLLMDEPTGAMDHTSEEAVKAALRNFAHDRTLIVVTHRRSLLDLADRILILDHGRVVADGPKAEVMAALADGRVGSGL